MLLQFSLVDTSSPLLTRFWGGPEENRAKYCHFCFELTKTEKGLEKKCYKCITSEVPGVYTQKSKPSKNYLKNHSKNRLNTFPKHRPKKLRSLFGMCEQLPMLSPTHFLFISYFFRPLDLSAMARS